MIGRDAPAGRLNFIWALAFTGLLSACSGGSDKTTSNNTSGAFLVSGSVGDGPIVDARMTVTDASGTVVLSTTGDSTAKYKINVPGNVLLPVIIRASGGTDLVTGRAADFELMAVVMASGEQTINVSPLTTLAVQTATCSTGGLSAASLQNSWNTIHREVAMGLDSALVSDPMGETVTGANVEMVVLANEALGEVVRRTQIALTAAGTTISTDEVIRQLGCDLADGDLDGVGSAVNARVISTFRAVEAAVLLEVIAGRLEVDGQDATVLMDQAIRTVMPSFSPDVAGVSVTNDIVDQAQDALAILQGVYPDAELFAFATLLSEIDPAIAKSDVDAVLSSASLVALHGLAARVANASTTEIDLLANRMRVQEQADAPVVSFGTDEVSVAEGGTTMLSWATMNADQCVAAKGWSGPVALTGTYQTDPLTTTTEFSLICAGIGGTTIESVTVEVTGILPPNPDPAPTVGISATEVAVFSGQSTTLNWSSENANSCSASGGWSGSRGTSGSEIVGPLVTNTTFTLSCTGSGGTSTDSATVTVTSTPAPTLSFSAADSVVDSGENTTLNWSSQNAGSCTASGGWSGSKGTSGSATVGPLTMDTTFTLSCTGSGGTLTNSTTVTVTPAPPPTLSFSATEAVVDSGDTTTLNWSSQHASSCMASGGWSGSKGTSGSATVGPLTVDTTFTLSCTGSGGTLTNSTTVTVTPAPPPTLSFSATEAVVDSGDTTTLNWSSQNAGSCTASGGWSGSKGTNGSEAVGPLSANTTFSITCTGAGGNAVSMLTVSVNGVLQLSWVAPTENVDGSPLTDLAGYKIYYGTQAQNYPDWTDVSDASATQFELTLPMGTYYVTMTALDADGNESVYSNEVIKIPI